MQSTIARGLLNKFNRGVVSKSLFAREDFDKISSSAETMTNMLAKRLGPMVFRPGTEKLDTVDTSARMFPFVVSDTEKYLAVWDADGIRIMQDGAFLDASSGSPTITNGSTFAGLTGWTDADDAGCTSSGSGGYLVQVGNVTGAARVYQSVTMTANVWNYWKITIQWGPVRVMFGNAGGDGTFFDQELEPGEHWIGINENTTSCVLTFENDKLYTTKVEEVAAVTSGEVLINPDHLNSYSTGVNTTKFPSYNWDQSADEFYCAVPKQRPFVLTRWNSKSFGISSFQNRYGPYDPINDTGITLDADAKTGDADITASQNLFSYGKYVDGLLIRYAATGQQNSKAATLNDDATDPILVFGTGDARKFGVFIDLTAGGAYTEIVLEKSFDNVTWSEAKSYTSGADFSETYDDGLDGSDIYYRLRIENIGAATAITITLAYSYGVIEGQWRSSYSNIADVGRTVVEGAWYVNSGAEDATRDWYLSSWRWLKSESINGEDDGIWPSAVALFEGRLWWGGFNKFWGSESDFYTSYDRTIDGDSASIEKTIGFGPVEQVSWMAGTDQLFAGLASSELHIRSNSEANLMTPDNTNIRSISSYGSAALRPAVIDTSIVFVHRSKRRLLSIQHDGIKAILTDLNFFAADILDADIRRIEVVRNPETRIYVLLDDGTMWTVLQEEIENVLAWTKVETRSGDTIEDVCVLPGDEEDEVYLIVSRGSLEFIELMGKLKEAYPNNATYDNPNTLDCFVRKTSPGTSITLTGHFVENDVVGVWVDGVWDGLYTVNATPAITGVTSGTEVIIGFQYTATWKSNKLTDHGDVGSINQRQRIMNLGFVLRNYYYYENGFKYGPDTSTLRDMPKLEDGKPPSGGDYDFIPIPFNGVSKVDPRIVIQTTFPVEVLAIAYDMKNTTDKTPKRGG